MKHTEALEISSAFRKWLNENFSKREIEKKIFHNSNSFGISLDDNDNVVMKITYEDETKGEEFLEDREMTSFEFNGTQIPIVYEERGSFFSLGN